ncbi:hypothetical protein ACFVGN_34665 [Streptomyces sp. NPDC057757]|uniref:hypothetical protein n=1 Tax=Streptomyces sp. NPDC057757 TaxID=3346241 RepID=UPI003680286A
MAKPLGAIKVNYRFVNAESEATVEFDFDVTSLSNEVDEAVRVGADAILAHLQAAYPNREIIATRTYTGSVAGEPWPTA